MMQSTMTIFFFPISASYSFKSSQCNISNSLGDFLFSLLNMKYSEGTQATSQHILC